MHAITVVGTGYVGLVTGACLADFGNTVTCVDTDAAKIDRLGAGDLPFFEPGLPELVGRNIQEGRLRFSKDLTQALKESNHRRAQAARDQGAGVRPGSDAGGEDAPSDARRRAGGGRLRCGARRPRARHRDGVERVPEHGLARRKRLMRRPVLCDLRNIYDPEEVEAAGLRHIGVGRGRP